MLRYSRARSPTLTTSRSGRPSLSKSPSARPRATFARPRLPCVSLLRGAGVVAGPARGRRGAAAVADLAFLRLHCPAQAAEGPPDALGRVARAELVEQLTARPARRAADSLRLDAAH